MEVVVESHVVCARVRERRTRVAMTGNVHTGVSGHHGLNAAHLVAKVRGQGPEHVMEKTSE